MRFKLTEPTAEKRPNNYYSQFKGQSKPKKDVHNHIFLMQVLNIIPLHKCMA